MQPPPATAGARNKSRQVIPWLVFSILAASTLAIFIVPVLFVLITRGAYGKKKLEYLRTHHEHLMEKAKKVEQQDIDPELEFEIQKSRDLHGMDPESQNQPVQG